MKVHRISSAATDASIESAVSRDAEPPNIVEKEVVFVDLENLDGGSELEVPLSHISSASTDPPFKSVLSTETEPSKGLDSSTTAELSDIVEKEVVFVDLEYLDGGSEMDVPFSKVQMLSWKKQPKELQVDKTGPIALVEGMLVKRLERGPLYHPAGSLAVKGANEDSARIAEMIRTNMGDIDDIFVTLDSHHVSAVREWVVES